MRYELTAFNSERFMIHQSLVILNLRTKYQNLDKVVQLRAICKPYRRSIVTISFSPLQKQLGLRELMSEDDYSRLYPLPIA